jgi:hypothetical protein
MQHRMLGGGYTNMESEYDQGYGMEPVQEIATLTKEEDACMLCCDTVLVGDGKDCRLVDC